MAGSVICPCVRLTFSLLFMLLESGMTALSDTHVIHVDYKQNVLQSASSYTKGSVVTFDVGPFSRDDATLMEKYKTAFTDMNVYVRERCVCVCVCIILS